MRKTKYRNPPPPIVSDYMGECFYKIATHLSFRPNFINYTYREEMVGDGIENCIRYAKNFNPEKSKNPFAYFTQIIYYAFLRRIANEKKQTTIKEKIVKNTDDTRSYELMEGDIDVYHNSYLEFLRENQDRYQLIKENEVVDPTKPEKKQSKKGIELFVD